MFIVGLVLVRTRLHVKSISEYLNSYQRFQVISLVKLLRNFKFNSSSSILFFWNPEVKYQNHDSNGTRQYRWLFDERVKTEIKLGPVSRWQVQFIGGNRHRTGRSGHTRMQLRDSLRVCIKRDWNCSEPRTSSSRSRPTVLDHQKR